MSKKIRFGIFGAARGGALIPNIYASGGEVVAICDRRPAMIAERKKTFPECKDCAEYDDFDLFIQHDMDAVLLGNYFCEHAEYAIKAMRAGKHVLSETISNITMAEGVAPVSYTHLDVYKRQAISVMVIGVHIGAPEVSVFHNAVPVLPNGSGALGYRIQP